MHNMKKKNRPKILFMAPDIPFLMRGGGNMRMLSIISAMSGFADILAACIADDISDEVRSNAEGLGIKIVNHRRTPLSGAELWKQRLSSVITLSNLSYSKDEADFFKRQFNEFKPDIVWLETPYLLRYAMEQRGKAPIVVDFWGTSEGQWRDYLHAEGISKIWQLLRWKTFEGAERKYTPLIDGIVTVTDRDAEILKPKVGNTPIWPVFSGMQDPEKAGKYLEYPEKPNELVFSGNMSFKPNVDAALFFADRILPFIRKEIPDASFKLVGRNPASEIYDLQARSGITVTGAVSNMFEALAPCSLYVLPMRLGSGYRTKLFDVFALGKAIVTTTIGAEGLAMEHGKNCIIADNPIKFAEECVKLLKNKEERVKIGSNMRETALATYSQKNVQKATKDIIDTLLSKNSPQETDSSS